LLTEEIDLAGKQSRGARSEGDITGRSGRNNKEKPTWQVRVGQFSREQLAEQRLTQAMKAAPYALRHARAAVATHSRRGSKTYVPYFKGMNKDDAKLACQALRRKRLECIPLFSAG
jgi:D-alanyl-D-alanine carboxypeptidase